MKYIMVTGGNGFIGSNFIEYMLEKYPDYFIINVDKRTYAGINDIIHDRLISYKNDINGSLEFIFNKHPIEGIIHFAAESHVDNSIHSPEVFIQTNINGTFNLLEYSRKHNLRFHHVSTDEVYGSLGDTGYFYETTPYSPNSPYSASKASSDMLVNSYYKTYGLKTTISNCSNNYGKGQHDEKLIPTVIRKIINKETIPIYGTGKNVRDWLYVLDHCKAIDLIYHNGTYGDKYNIGGNKELSNNDIVKLICSIMDDIIPSDTKYKDLITYVGDRKGHDFRYAVNTDKIENNLGWKPQTELYNGLLDTIKWYMEKYNAQIN